MTKKIVFALFAAALIFSCGKPGIKPGPGEIIVDPYDTVKVDTLIERFLDAVGGCIR